MAGREISLGGRRRPALVDEVVGDRSDADLHASGESSLAAADRALLEPSRPSVYNLVILALIVIAVAAGSGLAVAGSGATLYGAQVELVHDAPPGDSVDSAERLATQIALLQSRAVLAPAAREFDLDHATLAARIEVEGRGEGGLVIMTVADPEPQRARAIAHAVVRQYGAESVALLSSTTAVLYLNAQITEVARRQESVATELADPALPLSEPAKAEDLRSQEASLASQLETLRAQRSRLTPSAAASASAFRLLSPPYSLDDPVAPRRARGVALGALTGMVIAAGLVSMIVLLRRPDPTVP